MTAGLTEVQANGKLHVPHVLTLLGDAHRMAGQPRVALAYVAEAEQLAEATQSKWLQAETLRLRGELLVIVGDSAGAEASLLKAITLAQRQGAKLFELRASTSLARLLHEQGRHKEAGELLTPISGWFNDGFDAPDLTGSKALLAAIDSRLGCRRAAPSSWDS
jgi:predicted ATPase